MTTVYRSRAVTDAIITMLTVAGLVVGDGEKPDGGGWQGVDAQSNFIPYVVVHPIGAYEIDGPIGDTAADVWPLHQLTSYGATRSQCELAADRAREAMLTGALAVTGRRVLMVQPDLLGIVSRDDDVQPPIFSAPDRYEICTTPA